MRLKVPNLLPGQKYAIQVRSVSEDEKSAWSRKFIVNTVKDEVPPNVPTNIKWVAAGSGFYATWNAVTKNSVGDDTVIKHYKVEISDARDPSVFPEKVYVTQAERFDFTFGMVIAAWGSPISKIGFRVRAVDMLGNHSPWSAKFIAENDVPEPPVLTKCEGIENGIDLAWDASPSNDVVKYRVYASTDPNFIPNYTNRVWEGDALATTFYTGTYEVHHIAVTAVDEYGSESAPATGEATPISPFLYDDIPPEIPTGLTATRGSDPTEIHVAWNIPATDDSLAGYNIQYIKQKTYDNNPVDNKWNGAGMVDAAMDRSEHVITNVDEFSGYVVRMRAYDTYANYSDWSTEATVASRTNPVPAAVTGVTIKAYTNEPVFEVVWNKHPDTDIREYQIQVDRVNTFNGAYLRNYYTDGNTVTVGDLTPGIDYHVRVRALDQRDDPSVIPWSTTVTIQANELNLSDGQAPSVAPTVTVTPRPGSLLASWPAIANNDPVTYEVRYGPDTLNLTLFEETASTSSVITGLPYSEHVVVVTPKDVDGTGPASTAVAGTPSKVTNEDIDSLSIGKITSGTIDTASMVIASTGEIKSSNYTTTTGWLINSAGITLHEGTVSATTFKGGTISGTTINIGAGGVLNVDNTAQLKSSNYVAGSTGWKLDSSGLEVNTLHAKISASNISGGTFNAGSIYVSSGGGIYDTNGYWSITPSSISISNGTINAATVTTGAMRSSQPARDASGLTISGTYAWQIDTQGDAILGNAFVRGRLIVGTAGTAGSGVIQSYNWSPGSTGYQIGSSGAAEFNDAYVYGGRFSTQNYANGFIELGDTGPNDPTDEIRFFNNGSVSSIRNKSGEAAPNLYFSFPGGAVKFHVTDWPCITAPNQHTIKFAGAAVQIRNAGDTAYSDFVASEVKATRGIDVSGGSLQMSNNNILGTNIIYTKEVSSVGAEIRMNFSNGSVNFAGGANITGKMYATFGDSAYTLQGSRAVITGPGMDNSSPTSGNTRDLYATRFWAFNTSIGSASDRRLKHDISPFGGGTDIIKKVNLVSYRLKDDPKQLLQYGVIAQDSMDLMPGFIEEMFQDESDADNDTLAANYHMLNMATTSAVKELIARVEQLEAQMADLTGPSA